MLKILTIILMITFISCKKEITHEREVRMNKQKDQEVKKNIYRISAPIVKGGKDGKSYYISRSIKNYLINFDESKVTYEDFDKYYLNLRGLIKTITLDIEYKKRDNEDYVIVYKIISKISN